MVYVPGDYVSMDDIEGGSAGDGKKRLKGSRIRNILQRLQTCSSWIRYRIKRRNNIRIMKGFENLGIICPINLDLDGNTTGERNISENN